MKQYRLPQKKRTITLETILHAIQRYPDCCYFPQHIRARRLAPAYDLLPSDGINGYRTTLINNSIEPVQSDLIAVAEKAGLRRPELEEIFRQMQKIISAI